jgi:hypothetical protein
MCIGTRLMQPVKKSQANARIMCSNSDKMGRFIFESRSPGRGNRTWKKRRPIDFKFYVTYFLLNKDDSLKVVFYISHGDEQKALQEKGLLPVEGE